MFGSFIPCARDFVDSGVCSVRNKAARCGFLRLETPVEFPSVVVGGTQKPATGGG